MRPALAAVLGALLLTGCSAGGGGASADPVTPTPSPTVTPSSPPSPTTPRTPESEFAAEVDELYTLVRTSVEGSADPAASSQVLTAFATTVGLIKVEQHQEPDRSRVVDAAEAAAQAYATAAGITNGVERSAALSLAWQRLQALELGIRTLPGAAPAVP